MSEQEKESVIESLLLVRSYLEPVANKRAAEVRQTYDKMVEEIRRINFPDLQANLMRQAEKFHGYILEHQAPLAALDKALLYARQTDAATLTKERIKQIAETDGWLNLKIF